MKSIVRFVLALVLAIFVSGVVVADDNPGMLLHFRLATDNSRVLSTQNIALPTYSPSHRKIEDFDKGGYLPVRGFNFDDQFKFLGKVSKNVPFIWKENETAIYLVFKATPIKADTFLLELNENRPTVKRIGDLTGKEFLFLPTTFQTEKELNDSELFKALKSEHNAALAKGIADWMQSHPPGK